MWFVYAILVPVFVSAVTYMSLQVIRLCRATARVLPMTTPSDRTERAIIADLASQHMLPPGAFAKWLDEYYGDGYRPAWNEAHLGDAFTAGFHLAFWVMFSRVADVAQVVPQVPGQDSHHDGDPDQGPAEPLKGP